MTTLDEALVTLCAPTLMGEKAGSLFSSDFRDEEEMLVALRTLNGRLSASGVSVLPLRRREGRALLYCVRFTLLARALAGREAWRILRACGYERPGVAPCLARLRERLGKKGGFPHEIGLFLGFPPRDVAGFLQGERCLFAGYWKVYHDPEAARRTFLRYDLCVRECADVWRGQSADALFDRLSDRASLRTERS